MSGIIFLYKKIVTKKKRFVLFCNLTRKRETCNIVIKITVIIITIIGRRYFTEKNQEREEERNEIREYAE